MAIFATTILSVNLIKTTIITESILSIVINYIGPISMPINYCICATCRGSSTYNDNCWLTVSIFVEVICAVIIYAAISSVAFLVGAVNLMAIDSMTFTALVFIFADMIFAVSISMATNSAASIFVAITSAANFVTIVSVVGRCHGAHVLDLQGPGKRDHLFPCRRHRGVRKIIRYRQSVGIKPWSWDLRSPSTVAAAAMAAPSRRRERQAPQRFPGGGLATPSPPAHAGGASPPPPDPVPPGAQPPFLASMARWLPAVAIAANCQTRPRHEDGRAAPVPAMQRTPRPPDNTPAQRRTKVTPTSGHESRQPPDESAIAPARDQGARPPRSRERPPSLQLRAQRARPTGEAARAAAQMVLLSRCALRPTWHRRRRRPPLPSEHATAIGHPAPARAGSANPPPSAPVPLGA